MQLEADEALERCRPNKSFNVDSNKAPPKKKGKKAAQGVHFWAAALLAPIPQKHGANYSRTTPVKCSVQQRRGGKEAQGAMRDPGA